MEGSGRGFRGARGGGRGCSDDAWAAGSGGDPSACPGCGGAADPGCPMCDGTGVSLSELGFTDDDDDKKAKTKSKKKRERKARAKAAKKSQEEEEEEEESMAVAAVGRGGGLRGQCNGRGAVNGNGGGEGSERHSHRPTSVNKTNGPQRPKSRSGDVPFVESRRGSGLGLDVAAAARQRAGSSGMESAGSLLSMLNDGNCRGEGGRQDEGIDEGIDEDLVREMERLRADKAQTDVQRTRAARAALRSNLQKNFDQLLVSSTAREGSRG